MERGIKASKGIMTVGAGLGMTGCVLPVHVHVMHPPFALQIKSEFPQILPIKESLIKYVFEPNAAKVSAGQWLFYLVMVLILEVQACSM